MEDEMIIPAEESVENTNESESTEVVEETVETPTFIEDVEETEEEVVEEESEQGTETEVIEEAVVEDTTPEPVVKEVVEDPGDFTPGDYSYDITLADGTVLKIEKPEDIQKIPADADFGTPQALFEASANYSKMINGVDADKRAYEADKEKFETEKENTEKQEKTIATAIAEMNYLESKGRLPKYDPKYDSLDWNDPEVAKADGVKERLELINYRFEENKQRQALGLSEMSLIEAQMQMAQEAGETKAKEAKSKQAEIRKARGAMVEGNTQSDIADGSEEDMIIGNGGSIRDIR